MIEDSGERREFESGAVRDIQEGKGRCDLLPLMEIVEVINLKYVDADPRIKDQPLAFVAQAMEELKNGHKANGEGAVGAAILLFAHERGWGKYEAILEIAKHFEEGAIKYGDRNWEKGIPWHCYIDSGIRHYLKYKAGYEDEPHDRAFIWNMICLIWTIKNRPELDDIRQG